MGQLERDAKKVGIQLASDPAYGKATGCFWGGAVILGAVGWVVGWLVAWAKGVTSGGWVALGTGFGLLVLTAYLVPMANGWSTRAERRDSRRLRRLAREARETERTPLRWW
jgi:high-affinity Fe2+/Pb2+ permease